MQNDDVDPIVGNLTGAQGWAIVAAAGLIFFAFLYFGYDGAGQAALISSGSILTATGLFWPLRNRVWFRVTMACIIVAHVAGIILIPWPEQGFDVRIAPFVAIDLIAIICVVVLLNKMMRRS